MTILERRPEDTFVYALSSDPRWSVQFLRQLMEIRLLPETHDCPREER